MRIRKCAARLMGSPPPPPDCSSPQLLAGLLFSQSPPSWESDTPPPALAAASPTAGLVCQLNRSPWDDLTCLELLTSFYQEEEEEEDGGILGNGVKTEAEETGGITGIPFKYEPAPVSSLLKGEEISSTYSAPSKKKKKKKKTKKKDHASKTNGAAAVADVIAICKKTDGKGWHCKRRAQHPHTLCHYHLSQLRSYSSNHSHAKVAEAAREGRGGLSARKKKTDAAGAVSDFYYYYSGFGPWRGKKRSAGRDDGDLCSPQAAAGADEDTNVDDDEPVAGDDEVDSEDGNDSGEDDKVYRKRGRKKMKARSLKSLL